MILYKGVLLKGKMEGERRYYGSLLSSLKTQKSKSKKTKQNKTKQNTEVKAGTRKAMAEVSQPHNEQLFHCVLSQTSPG